MPDIAPYRMEIQQGNFVSQEMVSQLKPGMSKDQVRFVLGTALIADSFHADRWDYVFRRQKVNSTELKQRKFSVFFEDGKLARIEGDVTPAAGADAAGVKTPGTRTEAPEAKPQAPAPGTTTESRPAAQTASDPPKPVQPAVPEKPDAAPVPAGDDRAQEKSWWERLKDKVRF
ncbi:MAG: outer membrane protein assembly factor BamE [Pseudomonadota bacterium]